jgi:hypothetical protein
MESDALACRQAWRRRRLFNNPRLNGVDFLEVSDPHRSLCVHFFGAIPEGIAVANVRIEGGRRIRGIGVLKVEIDRSDDPERDDCLRIVLDKIGDFSTYRLCFVEPAPALEGQGVAALRQQPFSGLDPRYACLDFRFRLDCPTELDCKSVPDCPPSPFQAPEINYLAKDYASLRQMMLDRMALTMPAWQERHVPDLGVTLVELLAYSADYLSYYQDAVATEAYLDTARQRISVRRHVRLVDYRMHEGCNARAWVTVDTERNVGPLALDDLYFITALADLEAGAARVLPGDALDQLPRSAYEVFEPVARDGQPQVRFFGAHSRMRFYTWGDGECCLPKGATGATLIDGPALPDGADDSEADAGRTLALQVGEVLILEEVLGPTTGVEADADPARRHAVLLTAVTPVLDPLLRQPVLEIPWAQADALPFSLCLSARLPAVAGCARIDDISVARGNVVLVDHGRRADGDQLGPVAVQTELGECACDGSVIDTRSVPAPFRPMLSQTALTYRAPLTDTGSAHAMLVQDPRQALPELTLVEAAPGQAGAGWTAQYDLLASGGQERHFVVEMDDERRARLRFGDGAQGLQPAAGAVFDSRYRQRPAGGAQSAGRRRRRRAGAGGRSQAVRPGRVPPAAHARHQRRRLRRAGRTRRAAAARRGRPQLDRQLVRGEGGDRPVRHRNGGAGAAGRHRRRAVPVPPHRPRPGGGGGPLRAGQPDAARLRAGPLHARRRPRRAAAGARQPPAAEWRAGPVPSRPAQFRRRPAALAHRRRRGRRRWRAKRHGGALPAARRAGRAADAHRAHRCGHRRRRAGARADAGRPARQ